MSGTASTRPVGRPGAIRRPAATLVAATVFGAASLGCASLSWWPIYHGTQFVVMALAAIVFGCAIALAGALWRLSSAVVVILTLAVFALSGVGLAVPGQAIAGVLPSWQGMLDLLGGVALGWKQLVTIATPVGSYQALLVPAFVLILGAGVGTVTIALRARRGEWALLVPVALFTVGIVLGPETVRAPIAAAAALTVILLLWLAWFHGSRRVTQARELRGHDALPTRPADRIRARIRSAVAAGLVVFLAGGVGAAAALAAPPPGARVLARTTMAQPFDPRDYPSPLSGFRSYLEPARSTDAMLTVSGLDGQRRIRIATMDSYDGVVYRVGGPSGSSGSGTFTRIPGSVQTTTASGTPRTLQITVGDYRGVWLPGAGMMHQVQFSGPDASRLQNSVYLNPVTGTVAVSGGVSSGDRYRLETTVAPVRTIAQLADQSPGDAVVPKPSVVPDGIDQAVRSAGASAGTSGAKLAAALTRLSESGYISHGITAAEPISSSGHGADRITQLMTQTPMIGDQEQYAVAAALMARQAGFPARVVFGFLVPDNLSTRGTVTLTGADISAWIEVQTSQSGWVSVDPNPRPRPIPQQQKNDPKQIARPESVIPPPQDTAQRPAPPSQPARVAPDNTVAPNPWLTAALIVAEIAGWTLLGAALVFAPFGVILGVKRHRRRRRRNAATAAARITGGWREFADTALDHGFRPRPCATRNEIAAVVGGARPMVLAAVVDRAAFAPVEPSRDEADRVWHAVQDLRGWLGRDKTRWQRIRAAVSLASFGGYRGGESKEEAGR